MELEAILQELTYLIQGNFPRAALEAAIAQQEAITPHLLRTLEDAPRVLERMEAEEDYILPLYAFYLLAQFRELRACPLIVDFFSLPGEAPLNVTGDFVTENLGRVLASVSGGEMTPMKRLAENPQVDQFTRSAALHGLVSLVVNELQPRAAVIAYLQHLLRGGLEREYSFVWDGLLDCCADLRAEELLNDLEQAGQEGLLEDIRWFKQTLAQDEARALAALRRNRHVQLVTDTVKELGGWACFKPLPAPPPVIPRQAPPPTPKVGRNAPCPCGSGKKYKHCCGKPG